MIQNYAIQEQKMEERHHRNRKKSIKKQLLIVAILDVCSLCSFIFAMCFYEWMWVKIVSIKFVDSQNHLFWVNLLYVKQMEDGTPYYSFSSIQKVICHSNLYCSAVFENLSFTGFLCFCIMIIGALLQLFDLSKLIYYVITLGTIVQTKSSFRHVVLILIYTIGLSLSFFSFYCIQGIQFRIGIGFWLCAGNLIVFISVLIYGQVSLRRMVKQALIQNLIDRQQYTRVQQIKFDSKLRFKECIKEDQKLTL